MTRYIDVNDLSYLVSQKGLQTCITEMADYIRADYLRWQDFEKCARLANHSPDGVIELMPVAVYPKKYLDELRSEINEAKAKIAAGEQPVFDTVDALFEALDGADE